MTDQRERREYPRVRVNWPVTLLASRIRIEGKVENFNPKGVFVSCEKVPPLEETIHLVLKVPGRKALNAKGRVIWSTILAAGEEDLRLGVGIKFTRISEADFKFLLEVMAKYLQKTATHPVEQNES